MTAWTWACLSCNEVGAGDLPDVHKHVPGMGYVREMFTRMVQWSTGTTYDQAAALIAGPISREQVIEILGPSWLPSGDIL